MRLLPAEEPVLCQPLVALRGGSNGNTSAAASTDLTCSCFRGASCAKSHRLRAPAAIYSSGDGEIDPYRFTQLLLARAVESGLRVYAKSNVISTEESNSQVILRTEQSRITARAAVFATGYEVHEQLKSPPGNLQSTYAVASEPLNRN